MESLEKAIQISCFLQVNGSRILVKMICSLTEILEPLTWRKSELYSLVTVDGWMFVSPLVMSIHWSFLTNPIGPH